MELPGIQHAGLFVPLPKIKNHGRKQIRSRIDQRAALMGAEYIK